MPEKKADEKKAETAEKAVTSEAAEEMPPAPVFSGGVPAEPVAAAAAKEEKAEKETP